MSAPADLDTFLRVERPRLVAAMDLYLGDHFLAEEIVQEACVRAASRWSRVGQLDSPGGWTYRVARNLATSSLRRRGAERRARARLEQRTTRPANEPPDHDQGLAVRAAVASLPPAQREAVVLKYFLEFTGPEIAQHTGRTHGAVRALLKRGVASLRDELGVQFTDVEEASHVA